MFLRDHLLTYNLPPLPLSAARRRPSGLIVPTLYRGTYYSGNEFEVKIIIQILYQRSLLELVLYWLINDPVLRLNEKEDRLPEGEENKCCVSEMGLGGGTRYNYVRMW